MNRNKAAIIGGHKNPKLETHKNANKPVATFTLTKADFEELVDHNINLGREMGRKECLEAAIESVLTTVSYVMACQKGFSNDDVRDTLIKTNTLFQELNAGKVSLDDLKTTLEVEYEIKIT